MGSRHEIEVDLDSLQAHQTFYAKFIVFEALYLLEFLLDYFQTSQIYWFYDPLSSDANDFTVASNLKFRMNREMGYCENY